MAKHGSIKPAGASSSTSILLYGGSGSGKTHFIGTGGAGHLIIRPPIEHTDPIVGTGVDEWVVESWGEMDEVEEFARHNPSEYDFIWWDGISTAQDVLLDDVWADVLVRRPDRKGQNPDKGEYGTNMNREKKWIRDMIKMPGVNFGMTAIATELTDINGEDLKKRPWIQGKGMSPVICGYFNAVAYLEQPKPGTRVLRFGDTEEYFAKDQIFKFPNDRLVDPTMSKLLQAPGMRRSAKTATKPAPRKRRVIKKG